ncbi:YCF48-related protein [Pontibacterium granulatum]|uniref:WD40/YVTN/BNR-like repeat-containing protein n=1 Tax=Pontibacterium granulatum TaxID=2036029 RepID=UPI00249A5DC1|nr:YCF48-related protein [Pontibacterium granulatum]MDI3323461.1 YCF48-related protein [Pontibacterium granulatum]
MRDTTPLDVVDAAMTRQLLLLDITVVGNRLVAVGEQGVILISDDQGSSWRQARVPSSVLLTAVQFVDGQVGWAVGHDGVALQTVDGGESWQFKLDGNQINQTRIHDLNSTIQQWDENRDNGDLTLEDLEYALEDAQIAQEDGASVPLLDLWFTDRNTGYLVGAYGTFLQTRDGGKNWQSADHLLPNPDRLHLNAIYAARNGDLYLAGEAGSLFKRDAVDYAHEGSGSWYQLDTGYEGSFFALQEGEEGLNLMGLRGHLFRSGDGEHWAQVALPTSSSINAGLSDAQGGLILIGQGGLLLQQQNTHFESLKVPMRTSFSSGVRVGQQLILVGEAGITRVQLSNNPQGGRS